MCSLRFEKKFAYYRRCSLCFGIEENTILEAFVRFRFASVAITCFRRAGCSMPAFRAETILNSLHYNEQLVILNLALRERTSE